MDKNLSDVRVQLAAVRQRSSRQRGIMDTITILTELETERDRLNRAIAALRGAHKSRGRGRGEAAGRSSNGRKRHLSAAARRRISQAMKARWAARKKAV